MINIVNFTLLGKQHTIRTTQRAEDIQAVANLVNDKIKFLAQRQGAEPSATFAMAAALELAGELYKLRRDYNRLLTLAKKDE